MTMRALPGNMNRNSPGAHRGNKWVYWAPHPIEVIDAESYFLPISHHVARTDEIAVYAEHADGSWHQATFVVLHSETKCVIVRRMGAWELFTLEVTGVELVERGNERFDVVETGTGRTLKKDADRTTAHALAQAYRAAPLAVDPPTLAGTLNRGEMQSKLKELTGKGMPPGTPTEDIAAALAKAKEAA